MSARRNLVAEALTSSRVQNGEKLRGTQIHVTINTNRISSRDSYDDELPSYLYAEGVQDALQDTYNDLLLNPINFARFLTYDTTREPGSRRVHGSAVDPRDLSTDDSGELTSVVTPEIGEKYHRFHVHIGMYFKHPGFVRMDMTKFREAFKIELRRRLRQEHPEVPESVLKRLSSVRIAFRFAPVTHDFATLMYNKKKSHIPVQMADFTQP